MKRKTQTNQGKTFTLANFAAILGVAVLVIFTFLGHSFLSGGELVGDILIALITGVVSSFFLWFLIKAKKAENDLEKWRVFEYVALGIFVVFALFTGYAYGFGHFFEVQSNKESIKGEARKDFEKINGMFADYRNFETDAINTTCDGLENAVRSTSSRTDALNKFIEDESFDKSRTGVDAYKRKKERELLGSGYKAFVRSDSTEFAEVQNIIESWSMIKLPFQAKRMEDLTGSISKELTNLSENANLPKVYRNGYGKYTVGELQQAKIALDGELKFSSALSETNGLGFRTWLIIILVNALVLFPYLTARRTLVLRGRGLEDDGGILI